MILESQPKIIKPIQPECLYYFSLKNQPLSAMKILKREQIQEADAYTIAHEPISSILLMERAARKAYDHLTHTFYTKDQLRTQNLRLHFVCGTGNNGGDGLYMARLAKADYLNVAVSLAKSASYSDDNLFQQMRLKEKELECTMIEHAHELTFAPNDIIIDALFGTGLSRPLQNEWAEWPQKINKYPNPVISIDMPSGLMADENLNNTAENIVQAKATLTFQCPKRAFFVPPLCKKVGYHVVLDIGLHPAYMAGVEVSHMLIDKHLIKRNYRKPDTFRSKIEAGRALLVAGSEGKEGAALLAARACKKSGVGLLMVAGPESIKAPMLTLLPEAMVLNKNVFVVGRSNFNYQKMNAIGMGPGMGTDEESTYILKDILTHYSKPLVLDADALTLIAENDLLPLLPENSILTPHMGEFKRLFGEVQSHEEALQLAVEKAQKLKIIIVLKGRFTAIVAPDGKTFFNITGNTGMATGGSGDVLTGIITALLAGGYLPLAAAQMAVYLHGISGDLALERQSFESLIASDLVHFLGKAFKKITSY